MLLVCSSFWSATFAQPKTERAELDVLDYKVILEPNIAQKSLSGTIMIRFLKKGAASEVAFDCGSLIIDEAKCAELLSYRQEKQKLILKLSPMSQSDYLLAIKYHGTPSRGVSFFPEINQVHSVFHSNEWMVCNVQPSDRATIQISLIVPDSLIGIANGKLAEKLRLEQRKLSLTWVHETPIPAYTFGFAVGTFNYSSKRVGGTFLQYFSQGHTSTELALIFKESGNMLDFFQQKAALNYPLLQYNQILGKGEISQEMSGFTVIRNSYGQQVLKDSTQINLAAHELAHQWWGNMVTCRDWGHFWLNEGFAVFMSSAFKEQRFGRAAYLQDINDYQVEYQKVKDKGLDKPLVFPNWNNPSAEDRNLVYYKGAYVLHLLREELGDDLFWKGIQQYTQANFGKAVTTKDFQSAMEKASQQKLQPFFDQWCYK